MIINFNAFYMANEKTVYTCWEKANGINNYIVMRNGKQIVSSKETEFVRPYEFDNDHHTELFKPATRNWLYFKDKDVQDLQHYQYYIIGEGGSTSEAYESRLIEVYTE